MDTEDQQRATAHGQAHKCPRPGCLTMKQPNRPLCTPDFYRLPSNTARQLRNEVNLNGTWNAETLARALAWLAEYDANNPTLF